MLQRLKITMLETDLKFSVLNSGYIVLTNKQTTVIALVFSTAMFNFSYFCLFEWTLTVINLFFFAWCILTNKTLGVVALLVGVTFSARPFSLLSYQLF